MLYGYRYIGETWAVAHVTIGRTNGRLRPGESELVTSYQDAFRGVVARCRWSECI